eukprot:CAMPEP_0203898666 /NCGR_PEP_ID=MMETSP0359-20131031/41179_1 /ASSEMBLY_ACC=CAM_ASM_000338 /TAXON_ID=268821 /ORGANISM="Scrippsiella Hangoei, Strain SHTV-5" /LENGTH=62 /DNA_ID=CAMNT_0050821783 /DNA_START=45 /DNA_END=230 /DNA_ORIENTATION=-
MIKALIAMALHCMLMQRFRRLCPLTREPQSGGAERVHRGERTGDAPMVARQTEAENTNDMVM